ncbi:MAG: hypothetical protein WEE36_02870 [Acidimicrobiia bacterium]
MTWKRALAAALVAITLAAGALVSPAFADSNDVGNGSAQCSGGEICLYDFQESTNWTAQFWWSEWRYLWTSGSVRLWWNTTGGFYQQPHVYDRVSMVRNRDSVCNVAFYQLTNYQWGAGIGDYTLIVNDHNYWSIPSGLDPSQTPGADGISSHKRCP